MASGASPSATRTYTSIDAIHAASDIGSTMPLVPRMEMPPTMPSIGLKVRRAMRSPSTQPIARSKPGLAPPASTSSTAMRIIWRGTGLMAGSPGGTRRPGW